MAQKKFQTASAVQSTLPLSTDIDDGSNDKSSFSLTTALKPKEVVDRLNSFIIGQDEAKRAVAIALRNRWRRHQLSDDLKNEVMPKNILMIGPTGCGKTEIARRIAKLSQAPFIKVEATKFTEVGFVGQDVDSIIKDLVEVSLKMTKKLREEESLERINLTVENRLLKSLFKEYAYPGQEENYRNMLREGLLDDRMIYVSLENERPGIMEIEGRYYTMRDSSNKKSLPKKMTIKEAKDVFTREEKRKLSSDGNNYVKEAITAVEQNGIVFIDEIDKVVSKHGGGGKDASSEGVQRDLLPLIEGTTVSTKHGDVNTDFILFIASGAFHSSKPSALLAELQGRLPIRVTLKALTEDDFYRILTEPETNLLRQQKELLKAENVELVFTDDAIREMAKVAYLTNKTVENIGARRLHTIIERVVETISFDAPETPNKRIEVTAEDVRQRVAEFLVATDLRKYII